MAAATRIAVVAVFLIEFLLLLAAPVDIVMNGPRSPEDITNTHPSTLPRIKLTPSTTVSAKLITGATLFFNAAPSAGSIVSLTSTSAPGNTVYGALVQGAYNDNGACLGFPPNC